MSARENSRAVAFLAAFNDIESHLRVALEAKRSDSFWWMVDRAVDRHLLSQRQGEVLKDYGNLRNAISHGRIRDGELIADPHPDVVAEMQQLAQLLIQPPQALDVLGPQDVVSLRVDSAIAKALEAISTHDISQLPVYNDAGEFHTLLTTNIIARWVAKDFSDNQELDAKTVAAALDYAEATDYAVFMPRDVGAQKVIDALSEPNKAGQRPAAVIITETGGKHQKPLRLITPHDLGALVDAVEAP